MDSSRKGASEKKLSQEEFRTFMESPEQTPPAQLTRDVLRDARVFLAPPLGQVFAKLTVVHGLVGTLTLLACPQFGISPRGDGFMGLMHVFMQWGEVGCMAGCGAFFLGTSELVASLALRTEEVLVMRRNRLLQLVLLTALSVSVLVALGGSLVWTLALFWMAGSIAGGFLTLELGWAARTLTR